MDLVWHISWLEQNWKVHMCPFWFNKRRYCLFSISPSFCIFLFQTHTQQLQVGICPKKSFFLVDWRFHSRLESLPSSLGRYGENKCVCGYLCAFVGVCMCVWMKTSLHVSAHPSFYSSLDLCGLSGIRPHSILHILYWIKCECKRCRSCWCNFGQRSKLILHI